MVGIIVLIILIAVLSRAIRISDKLSARAWGAMAGISGAVLALSFWGLYEVAIDEPDFTPFEYDHAQLIVYPQLSDDSIDNLEIISTEVRALRYEIRRVQHRHLEIAHHEIAHALVLSNDVPLIVAGHGHSPSSLKPDPRDFWKFLPKPPPATVKVSAPESNDFKQNLLFWVSLFGLIVAPITGIVTAILAWISLHRRRAEALLMRLELERQRLEIEKLRFELERARKEYDESNAASPKIILLN